jgi:hypothetical protein
VLSKHVHKDAQFHLTQIHLTHRQKLLLILSAVLRTISLTNNKEKYSDETQQQPSRRQKTADSAKVDRLYDDEPIESLKDEYLALLKKEFG